MPGGAWEGPAWWKDKKSLADARNRVFRIIFVEQFERYDEKDCDFCVRGAAGGRAVRM